MTEKARRGLSVSLGGLVAAILLLAGFMAWGRDVQHDSRDAVSTAESACEVAESADYKATQSLIISTEERTARVLLEDRVETLEDRVSNIEDIQQMVTEVHSVIVRGGGV